MQVNPLSLHMAWVLFREGSPYPDSYIEFLSAAVNICVDWRAARRTGQIEMDKANQRMLAAGNLATKGLKSENLQIPKDWYFKITTDIDL